MRHKILQIDDANMAGFEWSYSFWLSRARDGSLTLTLTQSARGELRRDIEPTRGIAGGVAVYRALDEMMSEVGYALEEFNAEEAAKAIERLGVAIATEFRGAQRVIATQDATGLSAETDQRSGSLATTKQKPTVPSRSSWARSLKSQTPVQRVTKTSQHAAGPYLFRSQSRAPSTKPQRG